MSQAPEEPRLSKIELETVTRWPALLATFIAIGLLGWCALARDDALAAQGAGRNALCLAPPGRSDGP